MKDLAEKILKNKLLVLLYVFQYPFLDFIRFKVNGSVVNVNPSLYLLSELGTFFVFLKIFETLISPFLTEAISLFRIFLLFLLNSLKISVIALVFFIFIFIIFVLSNPELVAKLNEQDKTFLKEYAYIKYYLYFAIFVFSSLLSATNISSLVVNSASRSVRKGFQLLFSKYAKFIFFLSLFIIIDSIFQEITKLQVKEQPILFLMQAFSGFIADFLNILIMTYVLKMIKTHD